MLGGMVALIGEGGTHYNAPPTDHSKNATLSCLGIKKVEQVMKRGIGAVLISKTDQLHAIHVG